MCFATSVLEMPRPGPRPYECVRRAWHSDRHQPIRGSLIQEIFRVVNEIHSPATRKNKEWQDKLPIVVLKAEEIMYSKANSEAEYMDLKTLWDRANDAINTIIRLDETTETGVYLQPCIEAALNLGCTPRRTSRSQRNNTSSCYLNVNGGETTCSPSNNLQRTTQEAPIAINPLISHYSKITKPNSISPLQFSLKYHTPLVFPSDNWIGSDKFSFSPPCIPLSDKGQFLSVYPLYYGNDLRSNHSKISGEDTKRETAQAGMRSTRESSPGVECDLSLRLGPCTGSSSTTKSSGNHDSECFSFRTSQTSNGKSFLPNNTTVHNSLNSALDKWSSENGKMNVEGALRKRKAVVIDISEDRPSHWQPNVSSNYYGGRMRNAGS